MATIQVTPNLQRHITVETASVGGHTVGEVLRAYFGQCPGLRGYVLDDTGAVRKHMTVFVDGVAIQDRQNLSDPVSADGEVFIMQALSGG